MSESNKQRGLQRLDLETKLPIGFNTLSKEEQQSVIKRLNDQDIEIRGEIKRKVRQSQVAEHDLAVGIDAIERLDADRKIYSETIEGVTGSGTYKVQIRGGDTKFIVPILVVIGLVILGIVAILAL